MKKLFVFLLWVIWAIIMFLITVTILTKVNITNVEIVNPFKKPDDYINNGLLLSDENLSKSNGKMDKFYYNQLSDTAKIIYDEILANEGMLKTGTAQIRFRKNTFDDILSKSNGMSILSTEYQNAVDAIKYDKMDIFYLDFTKIALRAVTYTMGNEKSYDVYLSPIGEGEKYLEDHFEKKEEIEQLLLEVEYKKGEIIENAIGTNYQKIQYVHNWLIDNISYDQTYDKMHTRNIYGALIDGEVVCEGYAKAFKYLLDELEIPCIVVSGEAINSEGHSEAHMWNYVLINDVWYAVDVTWDDPILVNSNKLPEKSRYRYFCQGDNINENHFLSSRITRNAQEYEYPELYHKEN